MTVPVMWARAIAQAIAAVDWEVQPRDDRKPWLAAYVRSRSITGSARKLAWAAVEVDKTIAWTDDDASATLREAAKVRAAMADLMVNEPLEYDRILAMKDAYRAALGKAVWAEIEDDPGRRIDYFGAIHEE